MYKDKKQREQVEREESSIKKKDKKDKKMRERVEREESSITYIIYNRI